MSEFRYEIVAQNNESTVVAEYTPDYGSRSESYQSEADLEREFIKCLQNQAYELINIKEEEDLILNLRKQLEKLNSYLFSDNEWNSFFKNELANPNQSIAEKTATIQEDFIKILNCDNGESKNIYLIKKDNVHANSLQVLNQYSNSEGERSNRYDVTILVNGIPLVHVELKRRGVEIREAFNQISRYQRESFWSGSGLFEYVQIFVISNGTHTKYFSNTTRIEHIKELEGKSKKIGKKTSHSFEFTSWWADHNNRPILDLIDFAKTFFAKHALLNILTKYCVFTSERQLLVMRPYQIVATEKILNRIEVSTNYKNYSTLKGGGYIWHTTGSGKTLTSFKTAQLTSKLSYIDKVLFVVDRKDLDYQTMKEYDKFEKGAANSNTSTAVLKKQLEDPNARIIITTIQKLDRFINLNKGHNIFNVHIVVIFDECHRSQFGNMHLAIRKAFKKYHLFGFTGTPIFAQNANKTAKAFQTTEQTFGDKLHTYTIVNAIADKNVLPFKVEYYSTFKEADNIEDKKVSNIDKEAILADPTRISNIVNYILQHFDQKTKRNSGYKINDRRLNGFNSIFAVSSIDFAKRYYNEFKRQIENLPSDKKLKITTIFSFSANEEEIDGVSDENPENIAGLDSSSRDFLENAIKDYNLMFGKSYDTTSDKFQNYYKDVSEKVKNREIDILIVVNMFLTGFDATTLNTLWVDKNLRLHGLLQAFSRTNRILNSIKTFGNIVCFRNLENATNEAIALFGDKEASGLVLLKTYEEYYNGYNDIDGKFVRGYKNYVDELLEKFPVDDRIISETDKKEFIKLYGVILKLRNILIAFDEFEGNEILTERDLQDYHSMYIDLYDEFRRSTDSEKEIVNDDIVFEMELIKQIEINIDYILELIKKYHETNLENKEISVEIKKVIDSSFELRNKKDLILQFVATLNKQSVVDDAWKTHVMARKDEELEQIINDENLNREEALKFIRNSFRDGFISETGTALTNVLPPVSRFDPKGERSRKRETVLEKFIKFFDRYFDIISKDAFE